MLPKYQIQQTVVTLDDRYGEIVDIIIAHDGSEYEYQLVMLDTRKMAYYLEGELMPCVPGGQG